MKTTEFIKESIDQPEYNDEVGMVKSNLHTLVRTSVELAKSLQGNENLPEWAQEKIAVAKSMIVAVGDYILSQHEMGQQPKVDSFDMDRAFAEAMIKEDATAGASCSSTIAVTPQTLGEKGSFSKKEVNKKLGGYTNQLTSGGPVKLGKAK